MILKLVSVIVAHTIVVGSLGSHRVLLISLYRFCPFLKLWDVSETIFLYLGIEEKTRQGFPPSWGRRMGGAPEINLVPS